MEPSKAWPCQLIKVYLSHKKATVIVKMGSIRAEQLCWVAIIVLGGNNCLVRKEIVRRKYVCE